MEITGPWSCCFINGIRNAGIMGIIHLDDRSELLSVIVMNHFLQQLFPACIQPDWLVLPDLTGHTVLWELIVFYMEQCLFSMLILIILLYIFLSSRCLCLRKVSSPTASLINNRKTQTLRVVFDILFKNHNLSLSWWRRFKGKFEEVIPKTEGI